MISSNGLIRSHTIQLLWTHDDDDDAVDQLTTARVPDLPAGGAFI